MKYQGKIQVINKYFFPVVGGGEVYIREVFGRLAARGFDVEIHTSRNTSAENNVLPQKDVVFGLPVFRHKGILGTFWPPAPKDQYSAVVLNNFNLLPHAYILFRAMVSKLLGRKKYALLLIPHGGFTPAWQVFPLFQRTVKRIFNRLPGVFLINSAVDQVIAVSKYEQAQIIAQGVRPELITVIGTGVESAAFENVETLARPSVRQLISSAGSYLVQLGRIDPVKNIETSIKALALLPATIKLIIAGQTTNATYESRLKKLVEDLSLKGRVVFAGQVEGSDKYLLLKKARALVHLSLSEASPLAIDEALSQGLPCVVSDHPALAEIIQEGAGGYLVPAQDEKKAAQALARVLLKEENLIGRNMDAAKLPSRVLLTWDAVSEKVESILSESVVPAKNARGGLSVNNRSPRLSVTVGIPTCYSEQSLLLAAKSITGGTRRPDELLVRADRTLPSDGLVRGLSDMGVAYAWNDTAGSQFKKLRQLVKDSKSDIFVFTQDDVVFAPGALEELVAAFEHNPDLTMAGAKIRPLPPDNLVETSLGAMVRIVDEAAAKWRGGDNYLAANGRCLAFRASHLRRMRLPEHVINGDAFLYLENKSLGGRFAAVRTAEVYIRCPRKLSDQVGPSSRAQYSRREMSAYFPEKVSYEYDLPKGYLGKSSLSEFFLHPLAVLGYCGIYIYTRLYRQPAREVVNTLWEVDLSTKQASETKPGAAGSKIRHLDRTI